ncbi:unnamed protein product [Sphagnum jensenii]|uniref:Uncharacterized protein n=1 Tax=Sphagnum jensenii TaxID=128206 RepID=A0ABP0WX49_9BRYO
MAGSSHVDKLKLSQALYTGGNIATTIGNGTNDATSLLHKLSKEMNVQRSEKVNIFEGGSPVHGWAAYDPSGTLAPYKFFQR